MWWELYSPDHRSVCAPDICGGPIHSSLANFFARAERFGTHRGVLMPVGTVKWFDAKKGFGFLLDSSGQDVFVHYTVIEGDGYRRLWDGEQVEYECTHGPKGLLATRCRRQNPQPESPPNISAKIPDLSDPPK